MLKYLQTHRELSTLLAILLLFMLPWLLDRQNVSLQLVGMIFGSAQIAILLAMGATLVLLTRNIDVSCGSTMGLCAAVLGVLLNQGVALPLACLSTLGTGMLAGLFNGVLVTGLRIPAIVATLGTLGLYRGLMLLLTGGKWIEGLPEQLKTLAAPVVAGLSPLGIMILLIALTMMLFLARTAAGRNFYATGDNLQGARQLGVPVNQVRLLAFTANGALAALAGMVFAAQIGFVPNQTGTGMEMKAIAACVLGGVSLLGGSGTLLGAILGAWFLTQIDSVLVLLRLPAWWNDFISGLVLLAVLVIDGRLRQALTRRLHRQKYARFLSPPARKKTVKPPPTAASRRGATE